MLELEVEEEGNERNACYLCETQGMAVYGSLILTDPWKGVHAKRVVALGPGRRAAFSAERK